MGTPGRFSLQLRFLLGISEALEASHFSHVLHISLLTSHTQNYVVVILSLVVEYSYWGGLPFDSFDIV